MFRHQSVARWIALYICSLLSGYPTNWMFAKTINLSRSLSTAQVLLIVLRWIWQSLSVIWQNHWERINCWVITHNLSVHPFFFSTPNVSYFRHNYCIAVAVRYITSHHLTWHFITFHVTSSPSFNTNNVSHSIQSYPMLSYSPCIPRKRLTSEKRSMQHSIRYWMRIHHIYHGATGRVAQTVMGGGGDGQEKSYHMYVRMYCTEWRHVVLHTVECSVVSCSVESVVLRGDVLCCADRCSVV